MNTVNHMYKSKNEQVTTFPFKSPSFTGFVFIYPVISVKSGAFLNPALSVLN